MNYLHLRAVYTLLGALTCTASLVAPVSAAPLPRANIVLPSTISVDPQKGVVTLPLHRGTADGKIVWYIVTDSSDQADAARRRAIYAPLLANLGTGCAACVRHATEAQASITFPAAPSFAPKRSYVASATGFPPISAAPGATAANSYTPFLKIGNAVINAPIVAVGAANFDVATHSNTQDRVVAIDTAKKTVTLALAKGFFDGKRIVYLSTEASDPGAATIERATFVPALKPTAGIVPIDVIANGSKQGLGFVAVHGHLGADATAANAPSLGSSMNVLSTFPSGPAAVAYSPLWNVQVIAWKAAASAAHRDVVLKSLTGIAAANSDTSGPGGKPIGPVGFVVNCPVIGFVDAP